MIYRATYQRRTENLDHEDIHSKDDQNKQCPHCAHYEAQRRDSFGVDVIVASLGHRLEEGLRRG